MMYDVVSLPLPGNYGYTDNTAMTLLLLLLPLSICPQPRWPYFVDIVYIFVSTICLLQILHIPFLYAQPTQQD